MLNDSYAFAEQLQENGSWKTVATDRSPELIYTWHPLFVPPLATELPITGASEATVSWQLPHNLEAGTYRLRTKGVANPGGPWEGVSRTVAVSGSAALCP